MKRRLALVVLAGMGVVASGCRPVESDSAPSVPQPSEGPVEPAVERVEKPEGVELTAIEFAIDGVELTMQAPKGAVLDDCALVLISAGTQFGLEIGAGPGGVGVRDVKRWVSDDDWFSERYLVHGEDAVLVELRHRDELEYRMAAKKTVGHVDYYFQPILGLGNQSFTYSPDEYRVMLYCASTLARKHPLPDDPAAVLEECGARLKRDDQGHVVEVEVPDWIHCVTDSTLDLLAEFPQLRRLVLREHVTDDGMPHLAALSGLESLALEDTLVTDEGVAHLRPLKKLQELTVRGSSVPGFQKKITGRALVHLEEASQLVSLDLRDSYVGDEGLEIIGDFKQLTTLMIGRHDHPRDKSAVTDVGIRNLAGLTGLRSLDLHRTFVTDAGLSAIAGLRELELLNVGENEVGDAGLEQLEGLLKLKELHLEKTKITDAGLAALAEMSELEILNLRGTAVGDAGLARLKSLAKLSKLHLEETKITDAGLDHLRGFKQLTGLWLGSVPLSDQALSEIKEALPGCAVYR